MGNNFIHGAIYLPRALANHFHIYYETFMLKGL